MSQLHRGLKLCPYSKPLLQGLFFDPKIKAPEEHSQLKIFFLSYIQKNWYRAPKIFSSRFSLLQCTPRLRVIPDLAHRATRLGGSPHLSCKRDQIKMKDYMDRRLTYLGSPTSM